jgi:transcriptional regulator with XRE-family HTH domain
MFQNSNMSVVTTFSQNLDALMGAYPALGSMYKLGAAAGIGPSNIRRFQRGEVAPQIDSVEKVAKAFKLRPCDILDPDLLKRMSAGEPLRMGEPKPPVMPEADWRRMSSRTRALIEEIGERSLAGTLDDEDVKWLHDALERTKPKALAPATSIADEVMARKLSAETRDFSPAKKKT